MKAFVERSINVHENIVQIHEFGGVCFHSKVFKGFHSKGRSKSGPTKKEPGPGRGGLSYGVGATVTKPARGGL